MTFFDREKGVALKTAFDDLVLGWPNATATTMFGCPSYQADGTLFAVLVTDGVVLTRLHSDHRDKVEQAFDTGPFQAGDRTVTKWVQVTIEHMNDLDALAPHVKASYESALKESD